MASRSVKSTDTDVLTFVPEVRFGYIIVIMFARFGSLSTRNKVFATTAIGATATVAYFVFPKSQYKEKVVVVGGGTAGIGVAAMLRNEGIKNVTIIEPSSTHYYQPLWTLVGGGVKRAEDSARPMKDVIPRGTQWMTARVKSFAPQDNQVTTEDGSKVEYDYLVVAAGMQIDFDNIPGLVEGLKKEDSGVVSIYDYNYADKTWKTFHSLKDKPSKYLFTFSPTVLKCAGAPQKIMWLLEDTLRGEGLRDKADISYWTPGGAMFGVKHYSDKLEQIRQERGVKGIFKHQLITIDPAQKVAVFRNLDTGETVRQPFDFLHVAPPMSAPDFLKNSLISDGKGWVDVDKHTLQSKRYPNVFALGDCTNTPNSKTAAAITSQAPVLVHNLVRQIQEKQLDGSYSGYASCPLIIARGKIMLAEFGYGGKLMETFSRDTGKWPLKYVGTDGNAQYRFFYFLKEQVFPFVYWNLWTRGMWYGTNGPLKPDVLSKENTTAPKDD